MYSAGSRVIRGRRRQRAAIELGRAGLLLVVLLAACARVGGSAHPAAGPNAPAVTEILWDTYGVPHIYARTDEELFRAFGWAQAHNHGDLLLHLYGEARGRAAEYWGKEYIDQDRWFRHLRVPDDGVRMYRDQPDTLRRYIDAFAAGINAYAEAHPEAINDSVKVVLPVTGADVLAHYAAVASFFTPAGSQTRRWLEEGGSNAWAIAGSRSASGHALLLANPHLPWSGAMTFFEAQLVGPDVDAYGATLVGFPVLAIAFNARLGWTHTVNTQDTEDLYELQLAGDGYRWNGVVRPFQADTQLFKVRGDDGVVHAEPMIRRRAIQGPVVAMGDSDALALRQIYAPGALGEWWDMQRAHDRKEFERIIARQQVIGFNIIYADADGNALYAYGGATPRRLRGDYAFWQGIVPGDSSAYLWEGVHPYSEEPRILDPPAGWVQNANDPPWFATYPPTLKPADFPAYMAPQGLALRPQRSIELLRGSLRLTLDEMVHLKHSTVMELADRVLPDLLEAVRRHGNRESRAAAQVLEKWDRTADADSRGGVLFQTWFETLARQSRQPFAKPWNPAEPLDTPDGLADPVAAARALATAAGAVKEKYGAVDVPWGEVHRLRRDNADLPANGGPGWLGIFRVTGYEPAADGKLVANAGDSYVAAVEFSNPVQARVLLVYGNASQPGSPHRTDQLPFFAREELRTAWLRRADVEAHLEERTRF